MLSSEDMHSDRKAAHSGKGMPRFFPRTGGPQHNKNRARSYGTDDKAGMPTTAKVIDSIILAAYTVELLSKLYVFRLNFFFGSWNRLDLLIVFADYFMLVVEVVPQSQGSCALCFAAVGPQMPQRSALQQPDISLSPDLLRI